MYCWTILNQNDSSVMKFIRLAWANPCFLVQSLVEFSVSFPMGFIGILNFRGDKLK